MSMFGFATRVFGDFWPLILFGAFYGWVVSYCGNETKRGRHRK